MVSDKRLYILDPNIGELRTAHRGPQDNLAPGKKEEKRRKKKEKKKSLDQHKHSPKILLGKNATLALSLNEKWKSDDITLDTLNRGGLLARDAVHTNARWASEGMPGNAQS